MMLLLATLLPPVFWLAGTLGLARACYQVFRPSAVPLCGVPLHDNQHHYRKCYKQNEGGACETNAGALGLAVVVASLWPLYLVLAPFYAAGVGCKYLITGKTPELPEEKAERLKKDLRQVEQK